MNKYPMLMTPIPRAALWGGDSLKKIYKGSAPFSNIAELWELSVREGYESIISNGEYAGMSLKDYLGGAQHFPLLIKFIDAADKLSVQVHPDDDVVDENKVPLGKTEMWYIIKAEPGAKIVSGLRSGVSHSELEEAVADGSLEDLLNYIDAIPGTAVFIPAGHIHAIGGGILLAEIQQNSDTTYRLYDYGRLSDDGKKRELHIQEGLSAARLYQSDEIERLRYSRGKFDGCLANCECFRVNIYKSNAEIDTASSFSALVCVSGRGEIICDGKAYQIKAGDTYFTVHGTPVCTLFGSATVLEALPSQLLTL